MKYLVALAIAALAMLWVAESCENRIKGAELQRAGTKLNEVRDSLLASVAQADTLRFRGDSLKASEQAVRDSVARRRTTRQPLPARPAGECVEERARVVELERDVADLERAARIGDQADTTRRAESGVLRGGIERAIPVIDTVVQTIRETVVRSGPMLAFAGTYRVGAVQPGESRIALSVTGRIATLKVPLLGSFEVRTGVHVAP